MAQSGKVIEFNKRKPFKHVKILGSGGTGDTHLFEWEGRINLLYKNAFYQGHVRMYEKYLNGVDF